MIFTVGGFGCLSQENHRYDVNRAVKRMPRTGKTSSLRTILRKTEELGSGSPGAQEIERTDEPDAKGHPGLFLGGAHNGLDKVRKKRGCAGGIERSASGTVSRASAGLTHSGGAPGQACG